MKHIKQYEDLTQKFHVGDFVLFTDLDNLRKNTGIYNSLYDEFNYFFKNNIGEIRNAWTEWVEVKYNNIPKSLAKFAEIYDGKTAVFECSPNDLRFATDIEINSTKYNI